MSEMTEQTHDQRIDALTETLDFEVRKRTEKLCDAAGTIALHWALAKLDHLAVDTLYTALKVYDRSLTPDDNWGHSISMDIQDLLELFPENARQRYENDPCTRLDVGEHDASISFIQIVDWPEPASFRVCVRVKGSGDYPGVTVSKNKLDEMFLKVGIPEGTAPDAVKDFPCRVVIEDHMGETEAGYAKPWHRIAAFLPPTDRTLNTTAKWALERSLQSKPNSSF